MFGKIVYWNQPKGYGFIHVTEQASPSEAPNSETYFFHNSNFSKGDVPILGAYVVFNLGQSVRPDKPVQAINVRFATADDIRQAKNLMAASTIGADALKVGA